MCHVYPNVDSFTITQIVFLIIIRNYHSHVGKHRRRETIYSNFHHLEVDTLSSINPAFTLVTKGKPL